MRWPHHHPSARSEVDLPEAMGEHPRPMTTFETALQLLSNGSPAQAQQLVQKAAAEAEQRFGAQSVEHAAALADLARLALAVGDFAGGAEALKRATEATPQTTKEARAARLTHQLHFGEVLQRLGRLDEARATLDECVKGRRELYGEGSEGLAFGQVMLADVLFWQGEVKRSEELIEEAAGVLWHERQGQVVVALALRAAVRAATYGDERPLLEHLDALPPVLQKALVEHCLERADRDPPGPSLLVLQELRERLEDEEELRPLLPHVVGAQARVARRGGDKTARVEALEWLTGHFDAGTTREQTIEAVRAWSTLASAREESGDAAGAEAACREAVERAERVGDAALRAVALRNAGLLLARRGSAEEADGFLVRAVEAAEQGGDKEQLGAMLSARGVFLQHTSRGEEARAVLQRALETLPATHLEAIVARAHVEALDANRSCDCGEGSNALSAAIGRLIETQLPKGLVSAIRFDPSLGSHVEVQLFRPPTAEEKVLLERVLNQAMGQLKARTQL